MFEAFAFADEGFDEIFVANVGPKYRDFFALYGVEVLPRLRLGAEVTDDGRCAAPELRR